jgi:aminoglycoside N3'-acetyltransferase
MITQHDVQQSLKTNGYTDAIICLHASFRSFGPVKNGPRSIIDGFLGNKNTVLAPAFYYDAETFPPISNYERNGIRYSENDFSPVAYEGLPEQLDASMGIIPRIMLSYECAVRSKHPFNSFVALGEKTSILANQHNLNVYAVYKNIMAEKNASYIFLAGVDLTSCTPIHFAEELAGRQLFRRWLLHGRLVEEVEVGGCSDGFQDLYESVKDLETVLYLGASRVSIFPFKEFVTRLAEVIKENPAITKCHNESCLRCQDMVAGGPRTTWR